MTTEPRAERGHPPVPTRSGIDQCRLQDKVDEGAAQIAVLAQHGGAVAQLMRVDLK